MAPSRVQVAPDPSYSRDGEDEEEDFLGALASRSVHEDKHQEAFFGYIEGHEDILSAVNEHGDTLAHKLVTAGKYRAIKLLTKKGLTLDLTTPDAVGMTGLLYACEQGAHKMIQHLITHMTETNQICSTQEIIAVANVFPECLTDYLDNVQFIKAEGVDFGNRFPLSDDAGNVASMYMLGSEVRSATGLWEAEKEKVVKERQASLLTKIIINILNFRLQFWKTTSSTEMINCKAKVVPFENIIGQVADINDTALWALAQSGCDDVMCTDTLRAMLDFKWKQYAQFRHNVNLIQFGSLWFMFMFYSKAFRRGVMSSEGYAALTLDDRLEATTSLVLYSVCSLNTAYFVVMDLASIMTMGFGRFSGSSGMWNMLAITTYLTVFAVLILHWLDWEHTMAVAATANLQVTFNIVGFLRCYSTTGPFISMLIAIIGDMKNFMVILGLMLMAFSTGLSMIMPAMQLEGALYGRGMGLGDAFSTQTNSLHHVFLWLNGEWGDSRAAADNLSFYPVLVEMFFILFVVVAQIILLNLLIAVMGETFGRVQEDGVEDDWRMSQAQIILEIEARFCKWSNPKKFPRWLHIVSPKGPKVKTEEQLEEEAWKQNVDGFKGTLKDDVLELLMQYSHLSNGVAAAGATPKAAAAQASGPLSKVIASAVTAEGKVESKASQARAAGLESKSGGKS